MRRALLGTATVMLAAIVGIVTVAVALGTGHLRGPVSSFLAARAGRPVTIDGPFEIHLLSLHPRVIATDVRVGNPPWVSPGPMARLKKITLVFAFPGFGGRAGIENLEIQSATLHLLRDAAGHANWQWSPPGTHGADLMPIIRRLSMLDAAVELDDARRHLQFRGTVSVREVDGPGNSRPLRLEGAGLLNGGSATFQIEGEPLASATHATPYHFTFAEQSSGSQVTGSGSLPRPFDFTALDADFAATGPDLKDLYLLTGVTLINTGAYRLTGKLSRREHRTLFSELVVESGQSDMRGSVALDTSGDRPQFDADLSSQVLRLADLGTRAAGRETGAGPVLLFSNTSFNPVAARHADGTLNLHAGRVEVGHETLQAVTATVRIDHGVLLVAPLTGDVFEGKFAARARINATTDDPTTDLELTITDLQLGELTRKGAAPPPMAGPLRVRVMAKGHGTSLHQVAASAQGIVTAVVPGGTLRASLAELTGIDLRGVGLVLAKSRQETALHCAVASFRAQDGVLAAQSLVVDTDPVLITGEGSIHLDTEALDLTLHGQPKGLRLLRLHSPLLLRGTLTHPSTSIQPGGTVVFIDPGLAKDADCAGLVAAAGRLDAGASALPAGAPPAH